MNRFLLKFESFHSKDVYDKKAEWAFKKHQKNRSIDSLTEEQHDVLTELASIRHDFHVKMDDITKTDSGGIKKKLIKVNIELKQSGLDPIKSIPTSAEDYIDIDTIDELYEFDDVPEDDDERNEWYDDNYHRIYSELGELHNDIENYLLEIDKKHGTNYSPGGHTRIY